MTAVPPPAGAVTRVSLLRPWRPGESGNPTGRSGRFHEMQKAAREASPAALRVLVELLTDEDPRLRLLAANSLLDRAWGRPKERPEPSPSPVQRPDLSGLTEEELETLADAGALLERAKGEGRVIEVLEPETDPE